MISGNTPVPLRAKRRAVSSWADRCVMPKRRPMPHKSTNTVRCSCVSLSCRIKALERLDKTRGSVDQGKKGNCIGHVAPGFCQ